ncbi:MAG: nucleotide exchange factor GrpE [Chloroflexota bacterium]|nr:MAG: nucleotide exchange factor GrpE [Chloroflexota bacterium]
MDEGDEVIEEGIEQTEDIETLQQALAEEKERAEKHLASWQRCQADWVNYKQRAEQEKSEVIEFANSTFICNLLPIMDDLDRAFASVPVDLEESNWTEGIRLIYNKLKTSLEAQGLTEIQTRGEPFDPRLHEAIMQQDGKEGIIIEELQKGYKFKEKVIRPAMVTVGRGIKRKRREQANQKEN